MAISYLFQNRQQWRKDSAVGKTLVSSTIIDRVASGIGRRLLEVPVGFKWFVDGLLDGSLGFGGEESAGHRSCARMAPMDHRQRWPNSGLVGGGDNGPYWPRSGEHYRDLTKKYGDPVYERIDAPGYFEQKAILAKLSPEQISETELAGEKITAMLTKAPGNDAPIGGLKVTTENGWFAARPSGTEDAYKVYAESFLGIDHLHRIQHEAQELVGKTFAKVQG